MVLALVTSLMLAAGEDRPGPLVPWFVPRSLALGVFINPPVVTPHFRLAWEAPIIAQPRNDLIWTVALGSGVGLGVPSPMIAHSQHTLVGGLGYRSDHELVTWGFHAAAGATWYIADFKPGTFAQESRAPGWIEGRLQLGLRITSRLKLLAYFGYASPFVFNLRFPGNTYVGGVDTGLVLDWR